MSQSWDNVASMHELLTVLSSHTRRKCSKQYHLRSCISTYSTVHMQLHELWTYYFVDHTPWCRSTAAARTHHCNSDVLALLERRIYHQTMTMNRPRLSLRSRLSGTWPACWAGLSKRAVLRTVRSRMHLYGHPCLCKWHYNSDQSWAFWTCSRVHLLCTPG